MIRIIRKFLNQHKQKGGIIIMKEEKKFADMSQAEIEEFENKTTSIVLHNDTSVVDVPSFAIQKSVASDGDKSMVFMIDGMDEIILLCEWQVGRLKEYINKNF